MKRVLLYGFYGIDNAGNEAMLQAFVEQLRDAVDTSLEVTVAARHPSTSYDERYRVRSIRNLEYPSRDEATGRWLRGLNPDDTHASRELLREIAATDVVVMGPGQYLVETGEAGMLKGSLAQLAAVVTGCTLTSTPVLGFALACEPLTSPWSRLLIDRLLPQFSRLTFRDDRSVDNLTAAGIRVPSHEVFGDVALLGTRADERLGDEVLATEGIPPAQGVRLAWAPREIYWLDHDRRDLIADWAIILTGWLAGDPSRDVLAIPQSVYTVDSDRDDDRVTAASVASELAEDLRPRVHLVQGEHDPAAIEALYGSCDLTLSARLHGSVFSCKQGTPPIMLEFMEKTRGFFDRLGHPELTVPLGTPPDVIVDRLEELLADRETHSSAILRSVDTVRSTAVGYVTAAAELLEGGSDPRQAWAREVLEVADGTADG